MCILYWEGKEDASLNNGEGDIIPGLPVLLSFALGRNHNTVILFLFVIKANYCTVAFMV